MTNTYLQKEYEIQLILLTCATYKVQSILSILSDEKYTNEEKVVYAIKSAKEYYKEGYNIIEELQPLDISEIRNLVYSA